MNDEDVQELNRTLLIVDALLGLGALMFWLYPKGYL